MSRAVPWLILLVVVPASSQDAELLFELDARIAEQLWIAADEDDDDEDGRPDSVRDDPSDAVVVRVHGRGAARVSVEGPVALIAEVRTLPADVQVRGISPGEGRLRVRVGTREASLPITVFRLRLESPDGWIDPTRQALAPTLAVPNDRDLPRDDGLCRDPRCVRIAAYAPADAPFSHASLERFSPDGSDLRSLPALLRHDGVAWRSPWMRLVVDDADEAAPGVSGRVLEVRLRDVVQARVGSATQSARVGRPGDEDGPLAARQGRMRVRVMRHGGVPAVGNDDAGAIELARNQIAIANQVWLQCLVGFGDPADADVQVVDPPPPFLLAIAHIDGLRATGGEIAFRASDQSIGPIAIRPGSIPIDTATTIARAVRAAGFQADVRANPRTSNGAHQSADVLVYRDGEPVTLSAQPERALTTDRQQTLRIGSVDLSDGLQPFRNSNAAAGSLEERTLLHAVADRDPTTLDVVIINGFTQGGRQGEAFIESDRGAFSNVVILDRSGIRQQRAAWTQSHELGHVLLDIPFHPDDLGPDRPWLLMDADASSPFLTGPKRLSPEECARARHRSGVGTYPVLLDRMPGRGDATTPAADR